MNEKESHIAHVRIVPRSGNAEESLEINNSPLTGVTLEVLCQLEYSRLGAEDLTQQVLDSADREQSNMGTIHCNKTSRRRV
jgi:hypothetical protein